VYLGRRVAGWKRCQVHENACKVLNSAGIYFQYFGDE
jgi:hypothetical protein